jgi:hypothetical protein
MFLNYKKIFITLALSTLLFSIFFIYKNQQNSKPDELITQHFEITPRMESLLKIFEYDCPKNLNALDTFMQTKFYRQGERWQTPKLFEDKKSEIISHLEAIGWIQNKQPKQIEYDYVFLMGAATPRMIARINYFLDLYESGKIKCKKIYFLTGERPLDTSIEKDSLWLNSPSIPKNECEAAKILWNESCTKRGIHLPIEFINVPLIQDEENRRHRNPSTQDTVNAWLQTSPQEGSILAISNQPYCAYQAEVIMYTIEKSNLWKNPVNIDVTGDAEKGVTSAAVHMDNVARYIHYKNLRLEFVRQSA